MNWFKGLFCKRFGHRYFAVVEYAPNFYCCKRCGEPGFYVWTTS